MGSWRRVHYSAERAHPHPQTAPALDQWWYEISILNTVRSRGGRIAAVSRWRRAPVRGDKTVVTGSDPSRGSITALVCSGHVLQRETGGLSPAVSRLVCPELWCPGAGLALSRKARLKQDTW
jgi:hypothetical protein